MIRLETSSLLRRSGLKRPSSSPGYLLNFPKRTEPAISTSFLGENEAGRVILSKEVPRPGQKAKILHEDDRAC
jgi:hypothetical protein